MKGEEEKTRWSEKVRNKRRSIAREKRNLIQVKGQSERRNERRRKRWEEILREERETERQT